MARHNTAFAVLTKRPCKEREGSSPSEVVTLPEVVSTRTRRDAAFGAAFSGNQHSASVPFVGDNSRTGRCTQTASEPKSDDSTATHRTTAVSVGASPPGRHMPYDLRTATTAAAADGYVRFPIRFNIPIGCLCTSVGVRSVRRQPRAGDRRIVPPVVSSAHPTVGEGCTPSPPVLAVCRRVAGPPYPFAHTTVRRATYAAASPIVFTHNTFRRVKTSAHNHVVDGVGLGDVLLLVCETHPTLQLTKQQET